MPQPHPTLLERDNEPRKESVLEGLTLTGIRTASEILERFLKEFKKGGFVDGCLTDRIKALGLILSQRHAYTMYVGRGSFSVFER